MAVEYTQWSTLSGVHSVDNGYHLCLIGEVVGGSLRHCVDEGGPPWYFPIKTSRAIAAQVILGVAYLHSLGICHGGIARSNALIR